TALMNRKVGGSGARSEEERTAFLRTYPNGNIGMPLGPCSGMVAIDIDTDDPRAIAVLDRLLPPSPGERVGKKGMVRMYRYRGEKTTRFQAGGGMLCEILSKGTQVVLPPSIHPETKVPYYANAPLYEIASALPFLPMGIEEPIRSGLIDAGFEVGAQNNTKVATFVPAGQRDNTMVWHAGLLARAVTRGERTLLEALGEMEHWADSFVQKVVGDPLDIDKAKLKVIEFLSRDVNGPRKMGLPTGWDEGLSDSEKQKLGLTFTEDNEVWGGERILNWLSVEFQKHPDPGGSGQIAAINTTLARMAKAESVMSAIDEERIFKFISAQSAGTVTMAALKRELKNLRKGDIEGENHDEIAREVHVHINQYGELRYQAGCFWQWKGSHWEKKPEDEIVKVISNEFGHFPTCKRASDYHGVARLLRATAAKELRQIGIKGVNFANGFLTDRGELLPHSPDFGATYVLPYRYTPEAAGNMPVFNQYLVDSWGHDADFEEKVQALQEAMGVTLFGEATKYQRAICLFGQANSGKTVASQIMRALLPEGSYSSVPPEKWNDTFLPAEMFGKVLNFAGELSESKMIPGESFKQIVEGELTTAQYKNQQPFSFRPVCAQWFNSNFLPKTKDTSSGFNRRWLFLEWNRPVEDGKKIPNLAQIIVDLEREAIAAWAVQGFERMRKRNDFTFPTSHMALVDQMAQDNNSVRYFLKSSPLLLVGQKKTQKEMGANDLYNEYWSFCLASGVNKRASATNFVRMMRELSNSFDFKAEARETPLGAQEVIFKGIALAAI
uniref:phage/plasmid primase, P4 family n=1 Tax=Palleronia sp. TaxID=1940284 RepID=UPI0035C8663B